MQSEVQRAVAIDARLPQPGEVIAGKYRIEGFIARGGMGAVLAALHQVTGRRVALKFLLHERSADAEATHRLLREAQAAARVQHPNVVDVWDVGEHQGALFLVMELLEGQTLAARLAEAGTLGMRETLELLLPAMRGVDAAHRSQVVHRDLKPSNVFLCNGDAGGDPVPRVLDFGVSKVLARGGDDDHSLTQTGAVLGTPRYMAPEQLQGEPVDARADVYALGVILYQCLSGQLPFHDPNHNALVLKIAGGKAVPLSRLRPNLPAALTAVVMRAMAHDPRARFQSVTALIAALEPFLDDVPASTMRPRVARRAPGHLRWMALALGALLIVLGWTAWSRTGDAIAAPSVAEPSDAAPSASAPSPAAPPRHEPQLAAPALAAAPSEALPGTAREDPPPPGATPTATPALTPAPDTARPRARKRAGDATGRTDSGPARLELAPSVEVRAPVGRQPVPISRDEF